MFSHTIEYRRLLCPRHQAYTLVSSSVYEEFQRTIDPISEEKYNVDHTVYPVLQGAFYFGDP